MTDASKSELRDAATPPDDLHARRRSRAWAEHAFSQLMLFRALSLREKILAIEGMAEVAARISRRSSG